MGILEGMCDAIVHRGPDDRGIYIKEGIGLGIQRLSIIDLEGGHQPIHNEDKTKWIIFNGEVYNYLQLRSSLLQKGHIFYTRTDTEAVLHLYEDLGEKCLDELEGMFAFCIWDEATKELFIARDRLGKKPLYYTKTADYFLFASEVKSLRKHPSVKPIVNRHALPKYLLYGYVPAPESIYEGIQKLPPAHYLKVTTKGELEVKAYWNLSYHTKIQSTEARLTEEVDRHLRESVEKRLNSDVPIGVFLSGGIDSSLVVATMCRLLPPEKVDTFTIGFKEKEEDESKHARRVADHFGVKHHLKTFSESEALNVLQEVFGFLDEPLADPSILPTYLLSKFARKSVKVTLSGDGGDEVFGGYPKYYAHQWAYFYDQLSRLPIIGKMGKLIVNAWLSIPEDFLPSKFRRFLIGLQYPPEIRNQIWISHFLPSEIKKLVKEKEGNRDEKNLFEDVHRYLESFEGNDLIDEMMYLDSKLTFPDLYLAKVDRASMAASLEVRSPFLDREIVEMAASLPRRFKVSMLGTKYLLRRVAEKSLPPEITKRAKRGFGIPLRKWIREDLKPFIQENLSEERISREGYFNYEEIKQILKDHFEGKKDNSIQIWTLLVFQLWLEKWGPNSNA